LLGNYNLTYPLFTLKAGTYTISDVMLFRKTLAISGDTYIGGSSTFTLSEDTEITGVRMGEAIVNQDYDLTIHPQLELGTQPTIYEPYQGKQYTASFGETVHGGKWHVTAGGTDKSKVSASGWVQYASGNGYKAYKIENLPARNKDISVVSDLMSNLVGEYGTFSSGAMTKNIIQPPYSSSPTTAYMALREDIDPSTVQFLYDKDTPTTISTPKQNVPMLKGINTVSADCGDTSLKYQPDNVIGELKGEIEDIEASARVNAFSHILGTASSGSYKFNIDVYRRGDIVGVSSFAFDDGQSCPSGYVSTVLPNVALNQYKPIEDAYFVFKHISGKGAVKITLREDGQVGFSCYISESMTGDVAQDGWLFEQNWIQLAADIF
jgi:hypothetical protein